MKAAGGGHVRMMEPDARTITRDRIRRELLELLATDRRLARARSPLARRAAAQSRQAALNRLADRILDALRGASW